MRAVLDSNVPARAADDVELLARLPKTPEESAG